MKRLFGILLLCVVVSACDNNNTSDNGIFTRHCGNYDIEMSFSDDGNVLHTIINGDFADLVRAVSASGVRYVGVLNDTDVTLWGQGDNWTLFLNDEEPINCTIK